MRKRIGIVLALLAAVAPAAMAQDFRVLVFSKTAAFRHASIPAGIALIQSLGAAHGFDVDASEDAALFDSMVLAGYDVVVWLNTSGDVLDAGQQAAFESYVRGGGGWVGVHAAADTEAGWPFYGELLGNGAWFSNHPPIQTATLLVESPDHPSTAHLPSSLSFLDEWYNFQVNPRPAVTVLITVDESSYNPGPGAMGDHPITWCHALDSGRAWYTNLGHRTETYADPNFQPLLLGGIRWAAGWVFGDGFESGDTSAWTETVP